MSPSQPAKAVMMIRPSAFGYNLQTAPSNAFQNAPAEDMPVTRRALVEFDAFVSKLRSENVEVIVIDDEKNPPKPDAIFCNNWISFHPEGTLIVYPMMAPNRRAERRLDILDQIQQAGFGIKRVVDYSRYEAENKFLESTGSMVMDYVNNIIYACLSPRTHPELLDLTAAELGMDLVAFTAVDRFGKEIYHTNVVMTVGDRFAVICDEAVRDTGERQKIISALERTGHEITRISYDQLYNFAGNMLQVSAKTGVTLLIMSEAAYQSLSEIQAGSLEKYNRIVTASIPTIEKFGGGGVRCMMANIQLPRKS